MPESSTIILFGSGLFGMLVSFVRRTYAVTKRILDILAGIIGLIVLSPLFLITSIIIKLGSKGPIFYNQIRVGKNGKAFLIYKFRTMRVDAEKETGPVWASENDKRFIPCAKFLRKAHIDEIPQFLNILKGDMSLIGPRPERPVFVEKFIREIPDYEKRLSVKPGLTGLAQVWNRYDETIDDVKKKVKYDILYIKKICLWTDLRIFFRTFRVVLTGEGAR
ncbi:MAG: sugar transferase [Candidatus Omnitrophica bacterium]|nr:sugar transferase [Candidatus Omnitrophota bacterium]